MTLAISPLHRNSAPSHNRSRPRAPALAAAPLLTLATSAAAQPYDLSWYTVDGGGATFAIGGTYSLGATIGQPDAGTMTGGTFEIAGGFWGVLPSPTCYANCDGSTTAPVLNVNDFICFQARFASGDPYANCDGSTTPPVLNVNDFVCFQTAFAAGCP